MAQPLIVPLPPSLVIQENFAVRLIAIDQTTGATVTGVKVSAVAVIGRDVSDQDATPVEPPVPQPGTAFSFGDVAA